MRVAIISWFHYHNFGTVLQAYALSTYIRELGNEVVHISYMPNKEPIRLERHYIKKKLLKVIHRIFKNHKYDEYNDVTSDIAFNKFINENIPLTRPCEVLSDFDDLNDDYDAFICGSDQIWAPICFDTRYFLDFVRDENKIIAYAPSIGLSDIEDKYIKNQMLRLLRRFKHISVREEQGSQLLSNYYKIEAQVVADPTLLFRPDDWIRLLKLEPDNSKPYILVYFLGQNQFAWQHVKKFSKKVGLPIKVIPKHDSKYLIGTEILEGCGPKEFVNALLNADFVCTDSFHGLAFSINLKKPFFIYERFSKKDPKSQNSRIYSLLNQMGLGTRLVTRNNQIFDKECDFKFSEIALSELRAKSHDYLVDSLSQVKNESNNKNSDVFPLTRTCCGCGACMSICPTNSVRIIKNSYGFMEATCDTSTCINCEACKTVCPMCYKEDKPAISNGELYSLQSKDASILQRSSSGGAAYEISKLYASRGFDIIGCVYNTDGKAELAIAKDGDQELIEKFSGSKYIQSDSLFALEYATNCNKETVFFGLPCQISAVNNLLSLKKKRSEFILVDLICHGVPSQKLFDKFLDEIKHKWGFLNNPDVVFRNKLVSWHKYYMSFINDKKMITINEHKNSFYRFFKLGHCYAKSCYECPYRAASFADIRIGDYWGNSFAKDETGVSMVISMTEKGDEVIQEIQKKGDITIARHPTEDYCLYQQNQNEPLPLFYDELMMDLAVSNKSLKSIAKKYCRQFEFNTYVDALKNTVKSIL